MESQVWNLARTGNSDEAINEVLADSQGVALAGAKSKGSVARRSDPEDASQVALLFAAKELKSGRFADYDLKQFKVWLFRQGRDRATQEIRRHLSKRRCAKLDSVEEISVSVSSNAEASEQVEFLMSQFKGKQALYAVLELLLAGYSRVEIASQLGISANAVAKRIDTIRKNSIAA